MFGSLVCVRLSVLTFGSVIDFHYSGQQLRRRTEKNNYNNNKYSRKVNVAMNQYPFGACKQQVLRFIFMGGGLNKLLHTANNTKAVRTPSDCNYVRGTWHDAYAFNRLSSLSHSLSLTLCIHFLLLHTHTHTSTVHSLTRIKLFYVCVCTHVFL